MSSLELKNPKNLFLRINCYLSFSNTNQKLGGINAEFHEEKGLMIAPVISMTVTFILYKQCFLRHRKGLMMLQLYFQTLNMQLTHILFLRVFLGASSASLDDISGIFRVTTCLDRQTLLKIPSKKSSLFLMISLILLLRIVTHTCNLHKRLYS